MSNSESWQCLSVDEFWMSCNWNNELLLKKPISATELQIDFQKSWQSLHVRDFFVAANWNNDSIANSEQQQDLIFSTALSVPYFWQFFRWSGKKVMSTLSNHTASIPAVNVTSMPQKQISLADLSQLF